MKTKTRLAALCGVILLTYGATVWVLHGWYGREADRMLTNLQRERGVLLDQVLLLTSQPLRNFATDYSNWDEMLAFVHSGDPAWATLNIDASLQTFNVHAAWVLRADGSLVYGATRQLGETHRVPPLPLGQILEKMRREKFTGFFVELPEGLLEIRAAPIQPSADVRRDTEAQGWLLVGQLWDSAYQKTLATVIDSTLQLLPPGKAPTPQPDNHGIHLQRDLPGWNGHPVRHLHLDYRPESLIIPLENDRYDMIIFCVFGFVIITSTIAGISRWVLGPLRRLEHSMEIDSTDPLTPLLQRNDEFGRFARLARSTYDHRVALEEEVEERRRTETALRQSEEQVRLFADLRARLARDLHDNVIQSIYATGLGLESIRRTLRIEPNTSEQHLEAVRQTLNQLIKEIRNFITGLEPENPGPPVKFAQTLQTLANTLQSLHPIKIRLALDPTATAQLSPQEEMHSLQIIREATSNALRHGNATEIDLRLLSQDGIALLQIEDNGTGFDPALASHKGNGLTNLAARAREIGATLRIDSAPGDGTRLTLRFNRTRTP